MPSAFDIRVLGPGEGDLFRAMLVSMGEAFGEVETYTSAQPSASYLEHLICSEYFVAIAAIKSDRVVGGLAAYELHKFEQERSEMYVYDLAVAEGHRREGIATGLLLELRKIARARGSYVMFVQADLADEAAIALYTKLGKREDVVHFDIPVRSR